MLLTHGGGGVLARVRSGWLIRVKYCSRLLVLFTIGCIPFEQ